MIISWAANQHFRMISEGSCDTDWSNVGPYDFRDAENVDGIAESSHKGIYSLTRNVTEFVKFGWINQK